MKKILAALAAALLLCCPVTAFAAETQLDTAPASQGIEVYGQCISNKNYYEIVLGAERADSAHLPDGVVISGRSSASEDTGLRVIIIPVTAAEEPEAHRAGKSCLPTMACAACCIRASSRGRGTLA